MTKHEPYAMTEEEYIEMEREMEEDYERYLEALEEREEDDGDTL